LKLKNKNINKYGQHKTSRSDKNCEDSDISMFEKLNGENINLPKTLHYKVGSLISNSTNTNTGEKDPNNNKFI